MKRDNIVMVVYGIIWLSVWVYSNIVTWGTFSIIPWLVILGGYLGGISLALWQFH